MPHDLMNRHENNPHFAPLLLSLRYRCECATNEVLTIQTVLDLNIGEEELQWTVSSLLRDIRFEVEQHIKSAKQPAASKKT